MPVISGTPASETLLGTSGADTIYGFAGNDWITGDEGVDVAWMGAGDDVFFWHVSDGNDWLRGQDGFDTLVFECTGTLEGVTISQNATARVLVSNTFGNTLDLDDVERVYVQALAGIDTITINHLAGTDVQQLLVDLGSVPGVGKGGDAEVDTVARNGGSGNDIFNLALVSGNVSITGPAAQVTIRNADAGDLLEINGLAGNDAINASKLPANVMRLTLDGGMGNDTITGSQGNDLLLGDAGNDVVAGGGGNDFADLGTGNDLFVWSVGHGEDTVNGGDGIDTLLVTGTKDDNIFDILAFGGSTSVVAYATSVGSVSIDSMERIRVRALAGADTFYVRDMSGTDVSAVDIDLAATASGTQPDADFDAVNIIGTAGNDIVQVAWSGSKVVVSGLPATVSIAHAGANDAILIAAGDGNDMIDGSSLPAGKGLLQCSVTAGNDTVFGSVGNDRVTVLNLATALAFLDAGNDTFIGGQGNDVAHMGAGNDLLQGGAGNDIGFLGAGNDTMNGGAGNDLAYLGDGNDRYIWSVAGGNDSVHGGAGIDTLQFNGSAAGEDTYIDAVGGRAQVTRNVADGTVDLDEFEQIRIRAYGGIDNIIVNDLAGAGINQVAVDLAGPVAGAADGANDSVSVRGNAGNDLITVTASKGVVSVSGLATQVTVTHFDANDDLIIGGGDGNDTISAALFPANALQLFIYGGIGMDTIAGSAGRDIIDGGSGANLLRGGGGSDQLQGGQDNDRLEGGAGADNLIGLGGHDVIIGGLGDDGIQGGQGNDTITGGAGNDRIFYTSVLDGHDVILDFDGNPTGGQDTLHLEALFANLGVPVQDRVGRVLISDKGATVDVAVDADGNSGNGYELVLATLHTTDIIKLGQDVIIS